MMIDQVKNLSYQLRLHGICAHVERRSAEAMSSQMHPLDFLRLVLEDEILARKDRLGKTLTSRASFRFDAALEDWDATYDRGLSKQHIKELLHLGFFSRKENLLIFGKTGEGKTHLAIGLGKRLCLDGIQTRFMPVNTLFEESSAAKAAGKYLPFLRNLAKAKVIVLDDFGLRSYTHEEGNILLEILEERYRKGPVLVTSQVDIRGWGNLFDDPVIAEAVIDRLVNPSQKITLKGGSYRARIEVELCKQRP